MATDVLGESRQAGRGSALHHRQGPLPRRHPAAGDGLHGHPAQPLRPREHPLDRHVARRRRCPACWRSSSAPTSRTTRCRWPGRPAAAPGIQNNVNTPRILATDSVKWTGEGVAAVVAETEAQAFDAIDAIDVDWEPLPAVVDAEKAIAAGRAAAPRERPQQHRVRVDGRRQGRDRRRDRRRRGRRPAAHRQPAPDPEPDGGPRRHRLVQPGHRRVHDLDVEPDAAHPAAAARRVRDGHPGAQDPLHQPRRRRRVRDEDLLLRRTTPWCCSPARRSAAGR